MTKKIDLISYIIVFSNIIITSFLGIGFFILKKTAKVDLWIAVILAFVFGLLCLYLFITIHNYKEDLSLKDKVISLFGKKIGFLINLIIFAIFYSIELSALYIIYNFITSQFLSETPPALIKIIFLLLAIFINFKGINSIFQIGFFISIVNLVLFSIATIGLIGQIDFNNIKPILDNNSGNVLLSSLKSCALNVSTMFLILMVPKSKINASNTTKYTIIGYLMAGFVICAVMFIDIGVLGIHLMELYQYPEYIVLKRLELFNFIDQVENVIAIQWVHGLFFFLAFDLYFLSNSFEITKNKYGIIIISLSLLYLVEKLFTNSTQFNEITNTVFLYIRIVLIIIMFLITLLILIKKRFKNKNTS